MKTDARVSGYEGQGGAAAVGSAPLGAGPAASAASGELRRLHRLIVMALVVVALHEGRDVFIPITLAIILSFALAPLVNGLRRIGVWRAPSVMASVLVAMGALALVGTLLGSQAAVLAADTPRYAATLQQKVAGVQTFVTMTSVSSGPITGSSTVRATTSADVAAGTTSTSSG